MKTKIESVKNKEDFFTITANGKRVFFKVGYCRTNKKYECGAVDDINHFKYLEKGKYVNII